MRNSAENLIFEIGCGFKILTPDEIIKFEKLYEKILNQQELDYGYSGDGPYYDAVEEFSHRIFHKFYNEPEKFIQVIVEHNDWNIFGWALKKIKDRFPDIHKYAMSYMIETLKKEDLCQDDIDDIMSWDSLPS